MEEYSEYLDRSIIFKLEYITHQIEKDLIRNERDRKIDQIIDGEN